MAIYSENILLRKYSVFLCPLIWISIFIYLCIIYKKIFLNTASILKIVISKELSSLLIMLFRMLYLLSYKEARILKFLISKEF